MAGELIYTAVRDALDRSAQSRNRGWDSLRQSYFDAINNVGNTYAAKKQAEHDRQFLQQQAFDKAMREQSLQDLAHERQKELIGIRAQADLDKQSRLLPMKAEVDRDLINYRAQADLDKQSRLLPMKAAYDLDRARQMKVLDQDFAERQAEREARINQELEALKLQQEIATATGALRARQQLEEGSFDPNSYADDYERLGALEAANVYKPEELKKLTPEQSERLQNSLDGILALSDFKKYFDAGGHEAFGKWDRPTDLIYRDKENSARAAEAKQRVEHLVQVIGRTMEGGVLREGDIPRYREMLPSLWDSDEAVRKKVDYLLPKLNEAVQRRFREFDTKGFDLRGIDRPEMKKKPKIVEILE